MKNWFKTFDFRWIVVIQCDSNERLMDWSNDDTQIQHLRGGWSKCLNHDVMEFVEKWWNIGCQMNEHNDEQDLNNWTMDEWTNDDTQIQHLSGGWLKWLNQWWINQWISEW